MTLQRNTFPFIPPKNISIFFSHSFFFLFFFALFPLSRHDSVGELESFCTFTVTLMSHEGLESHLDIAKCDSKFGRMRMPVTTATGFAQLRQDFEDLKLDIEDLLANQNDINEDTRAQLELINQSLAAL